MFDHVISAGANWQLLTQLLRQLRQREPPPRQLQQQQHHLWRSMTTITTTSLAPTLWTRPITPDIPSISRVRIYHPRHPRITLTILETPWTRITPTLSTLSIRSRIRILIRESTHWQAAQVWYNLLQILWSANQIAHDREQFIRIVVQRLHSSQNVMIPLWYEMCIPGSLRDCLSACSPVVRINGAAYKICVNECLERC